MASSSCNNNLDKKEVCFEVNYDCNISNNDDGLTLGILLRKKRDTKTAYVSLKR